MSLRAIKALRAIALLCLVVSAPSRADWATSTDLSAVRPLPTGYQVQAQNPPSFTWSRYPTGTTSYSLELTRAGYPAKLITVDRNWLLPTAPLDPGTYSWRVRPLTSATGVTLTTTDWSTMRYFVIDPSSKAFVVPDNATLTATAINHGRSRGLPAVFPPYSAWTAAMIAERGAAYKRLVDDVNGHMALKPLSDSDWPLVYSGTMTTELSAQNTDIRQRVTLVGHQAAAAALLYRLSGNVIYLNEAIARGDQMAGLDPYGPTSYQNQDQATRQIATALAKTADFLWNNMDSAKRATWLSMVSTRTDIIYQDLAGSNGRMDQYPFDSHGSSALGYVAEIAALTVGDLPLAQNWFNFAVRAYIHSVSVWSGSEGGYANGSAYGQVSIDYFMSTWATLAQAININLFNKPWSVGFLRFFEEFVPPRTPAHVFGDGHEDVPNPNFLKAFASRFATPDAKWYYDNLTGYEDALTLLVTPSPLPVATVATAVPPANAALYPSIGWVAMHSNIADLSRTSLYFKSSPFGSYNHSHGDQNSLVLISGGRPLLTEAGYYDWYGSTLWTTWYRTTKAHNAITYDGGLGENTDGNTVNLARTGKITSFSTSSTLDFAEGDAYAAYQGVFSKAVRKIWYLRGKDVAVVLDTLAAPVAHKFEWNLHAYGTVSYNSTDNSVKIYNVDRSVCLKPISNKPTYVLKTGPSRPGYVETHAAYVSPLTLKTEFLMLLNVGCQANVTYSLTTTSSGRTLTINGQSITLPLP